MWSENCVLTSKATREADLDADSAVAGINNPTNATFKIKNAKLYVPIVTLSAENVYKLLEQLKTRFKRTINWNKYRPEMSNQTKNNNINYLDYEYFKDHYQLIPIDLSKQIELENPDLKQQVNSIGRLEENNATIFFIIQKRRNHF